MQTRSMFYSHVNYSVTKIALEPWWNEVKFYSHVNYSVTKISSIKRHILMRFTVT